MVNLIPRAVDLENDKELLRDFLLGREAWRPLPVYWYTGKTRIALYLTMFEGRPDTHLRSAVMPESRRWRSI